MRFVTGFPPNPQLNFQIQYSHRCKVVLGSPLHITQVGFARPTEEVNVSLSRVRAKLKMLVSMQREFLRLYWATPRHGRLY